MSDLKDYEKNCFNCKFSHLFENKLKCSLGCKSTDGSDYKEVNETDSNRTCWSEQKDN